jgi:hypothetical protein
MNISPNDPNFSRALLDELMREEDIAFLEMLGIGDDAIREAQNIIDNEFNKGAKERN